MLEARRSKVMKVIAVIAIVFGLSLFYFFFFNAGLGLTPDPSDQGGKVIVSNTSVHLIRDISVQFIVGNQIIEAEKIPSLAPNETRTVQLSDQYASDGKFVVQVTAPYHLSQQVVIQARSDQVDNANVSFTFQYPSIGIVNMPIAIEVGACNSESFPVDVKVSLDLPSDLAPVPTNDWSIPADECASSILSFTPLVATEDLSFKIRVFTPTRVLVEKIHHLEVIPATSETDENVVNMIMTIDGNADVVVAFPLPEDMNVPSDSNSDSNAGSV